MARNVTDRVTVSACSRDAILVPSFPMPVQAKEDNPTNVHDTGDGIGQNPSGNPENSGRLMQGRRLSPAARVREPP